MSLPQLLRALPPEQRQKWDRLYVVSDRHSGVIHPLTYEHHETGTPVTNCLQTRMPFGSMKKRPGA